MDVFNRMGMSRLFSGSALVVPLSFFPTLARAAFLSYFLIFLKERFDLSVDQIGLFVGGFILLSSVSSLVFGSVLDRLSIKALMLTSSIIQSAVYLSLFMFNSLALVFILCLLLNLAYLSLETAVRMCIARLFAPQETASVLSLKYTFTNAAYALGPLIGLWLNRQGVSPLLFCSVSALIFIVVIVSPFTLPSVVDRQNVEGEGWFGSLAIMAKDRNLLKFSVASVLLAGVFGQFHMYVGQYLITTHSTAQMYEIINVVFVTNALTSILLQYLIGRRVAAERFRYWICACIVAFMIGLIGFAFSSTFYAWVFFTAIFTVGEIIIQPLEFFYITRIAPAHMAGAYYSSQNLTYLGAASTPVVCGFILAGFNPLYFLLYLLVLLMVGGVILYVEGGKLIQPETKKPLVNGAVGDQGSI
ncbi:MFS family permease [Pseudomonas sp. GGS8]|uniref:MFS transporter n=1 Tax=Pseudomonas sp. GGS8 TaxID=2817892 RepID=UPI00209F966F|nr:MFS transporter [Pseudomonas sp. GGS8]MCP1445947.1 MFS family permease [Pseudomonas sp. GGS8]